MYVKTKMYMVQGRAGLCPPIRAAAGRKEAAPSSRLQQHAGRPPSTLRKPSLRDLMTRVRAAGRPSSPAARFSASPLPPDAASPSVPRTPDGDRSPAARCAPSPLPSDAAPPSVPSHDQSSRRAERRRTLVSAPEEGWSSGHGMGCVSNSPFPPDAAPPSVPRTPSLRSGHHAPSERVH